MTAPTERNTWTRAPAGTSMAMVLALTGSLLFSGTPAPGLLIRLKLCRCA